MVLDHLTDEQQADLMAVCHLYLSETRWVLSPDMECLFGRDVIIRRRAACELVIGSAQG